MKPRAATATNTTTSARTGAVLAGLGLSKRYGDLQVLSRVEFSVGDSEAVGIVGPNGAGKTTLNSTLLSTCRSP